MSEILLPKGYLSYSAMELWLRDKDSYRERYYLEEPFISTPYTEFGNEVGKALEDRNWKHPAIKKVKGKVPHQTHPEYKIVTTVKGVKVLGLLDDFNKKTKFIEEYKTNIRDKDTGRLKWNRVAVRKHKQLPFYTVLVRSEFGEWSKDIRLTCMETEWFEEKVPTKLGSSKIYHVEKKLRLTGHVEQFMRTIKEWELDRMEDLIRQSAEEITKDYKLWLKK